MPKLPSISSQKLAKALEKAGFLLERTTGSHCIYVHPETHKKAIVPIHSKNVPKGTLSKLIKEAGLDKEDLIDLL
jgi:predicted RNA binding protein YcfA (HicA-like mRNA interferase family)